MIIHGIRYIAFIFDDFSTNNLFIEVDLDPALGFIMGFSVFHILYTEFLLLSKTSW